MSRGILRPLFACGLTSRRRAKRSQLGCRYSRALNVELLEERRLLSVSQYPELPGMVLVDTRPDQFQGQVVYLDFDGAQDVAYDGPVVVEHVDLAAFEARGTLAGHEQEIIADVVAQLEATFAGTGIVFTTTEPASGVEYSTVYVGGDGSAFREHGSFLGLAESIDVRNESNTDAAFVFAERLGGMNCTATAAAVLADVIAHETAHLVGYAHEGGFHNTLEDFAYTGTVYWAASDVSEAANHHFIAVEFSGSAPAWDEIQTLDNGSDALLVAGYSTLGGWLVGEYDNADDLQAANDWFAGAASEFDPEFHAVPIPSGLTFDTFSTLLYELTSIYDNLAPYHASSANSATFVNTVMAKAGVSDAQRSLLGDFDGVDVGQDGLLPPGHFRYVTSVGSDATSVAQGEDVTFTANTAATLAVESVSFYRDSNSNGEWDATIDELVQTDSSPDDGWTCTYPTDGLGAGSHMLFAVATDKMGDYSAPRPVVIQVMSLPYLDLIFCIDTTGSMSDEIDVVKESATDIVDEITVRIPDSRIAVVAYRDFPGAPYGADDDYPYLDLQEFTTDEAAVVSSIESIMTGGGADQEESVYSGLTHCIDASSLGDWRGEPVKKAIILMGDAPPHDPEPFTNYTMDDVIDAAQSGDPVVVFPIAVGSSHVPSYSQTLADGTGGQAFAAATADEVVDAIMAAIATIAFSPFADAGGPYTGGVDTPILMNASGAFHPNGTLVLYEWDWDGDGVYDYSSSEPFAQHMWPAPYSGTIRMRVTDDNGLTSVDTAVITVLTLAPVAEAGGPYSGLAWTPVQLDASGSYDADGEITLYEWDWDSNGVYDYSSSTPYAQHTWTVPFSGTIRMRVTDNYGETSVGTAIVAIAPLHVELLAVATEAGEPIVRVFDAATKVYLFEFTPYEADYELGVRVATGDVTGDGVSDIIVAPGMMHEPVVRIYEGRLPATFTPVSAQMLDGDYDSSGVVDDADYQVWKHAYGSRIDLAADGNGDGVVDSCDYGVWRDHLGCTADVQATGLATTTVSGDNYLIGEFLAYASDFVYGVNLAVGDVTGDGLNDIVVTPSRGPSEVRVFENDGTGQSFSPYDSFLAYPISFIGGATVAVGDLTGDERGDIITATGSGAYVNVRVFDGERLQTSQHATPIEDFIAFDATVRGGAYVAVGNVLGGATPDIILGAGIGGGSRVQIFDGDNLPAPQTQFAVPDFEFLAYLAAENNRAAVRVAAKDYDGDGVVDAIFTAQGSDGTSQEVRQFDGTLIDAAFADDFEILDGAYLG